MKRARLQRVFDDEHVFPAHLDQPRRGHGRAHAVIVDQHDARVARCGERVGRLDQLAARRVDRAVQVAGGVFLGAAHVEQIECAIVHFARESGDGGDVDDFVHRTAVPRASPPAWLSQVPLSTVAVRSASCPRASSKPARCQPIVPSLSATTRLGMPALINDCAPMMLRVRPGAIDDDQRVG